LYSHETEDVARSVETALHARRDIERIALMWTRQIADLRQRDSAPSRDDRRTSTIGGGSAG